MLYVFLIFNFFWISSAQNKRKVSKKGIVKAPSIHTFVFNFKRNIHTCNKSTHIIEEQNIFIHFFIIEKLEQVRKQT